MNPGIGGAGSSTSPSGTSRRALAVSVRVAPLADGNTRPLRAGPGCATVSAMRRPPQDGKKPRPLHENATRRSWPQASQWTRVNPCASTPHSRSARISRSTNRATGAPRSIARARDVSLAQDFPDESANRVSDQGRGPNESRVCARSGRRPTMHRGIRQSSHADPELKARFRRSIDVTSIADSRPHPRELAEILPLGLRKEFDARTRRGATTLPRPIRTRPERLPRSFRVARARLPRFPSSPPLAETPQQQGPLRRASCPSPAPARSRRSGPSERRARRCRRGRG